MIIIVPACPPLFFSAAGNSACFFDANCIQHAIQLTMKLLLYVLSPSRLGQFVVLRRGASRLLSELSRSISFGLLPIPQYTIYLLFSFIVALF